MESAFLNTTLASRSVRNAQIAPARYLTAVVAVLALLAIPQTRVLLQTVAPAVDKVNPLPALAALEGTWLANGEGYSSRLVYAWSLPGVLLHARNELRNDAGDVVGVYEGHYAWDPGRDTIIFWTVARDGELHRGTAVWRAGQLWHEGEVSGGSITGYRSVLAVEGSDLHYRAIYEPSATDDAILASPPLVYRRSGR